MEHCWPHRDDRFSVTCTSGVIGKCVRAGYKPWKTAADGRPMWDYHQACTRLIRADYCGDGRTHTRDGVRSRSSTGSSRGGAGQRPRVRGGLDTWYGAALPRSPTPLVVEARSHQGTVPCEARWPYWRQQM